MLKRVLARAEKMGFTRDGRLRVRVLQLRRDAADAGPTRRAWGPRRSRPGMFGYSLLRTNLNREYFNALMDEMRARSASRSRACTPRPAPASTRWRSGFSEALEAADRAMLFKTARQGDRRALRHHAELHGEVERAVPGLLGAPAPEPHRRQEERVPRPEGAPRRHVEALRELPAGPARMRCSDMAPMFWPTVNSYKRLVDGFWAPVKPTWARGQPHRHLPRDAGLAQVHAARDARAGRRHEPLPRHRRGARRRPRRHREGPQAHDRRRSPAPTRAPRTSRARRAR